MQIYDDRFNGTSPFLTSVNVPIIATFHPYAARGLHIGCQSCKTWAADKGLTALQAQAE